jgi:hypothetical protein
MWGGGRQAAFWDKVATDLVIVGHHPYVKDHHHDGYPQWLVEERLRRD